MKQSTSFTGPAFLPWYAEQMIENKEYRAELAGHMRSDDCIYVIAGLVVPRKKVLSYKTVEGLLKYLQTEYAIARVKAAS